MFVYLKIMKLSLDIIFWELYFFFFNFSYLDLLHLKLILCMIWDKDEDLFFICVNIVIDLATFTEKTLNSPPMCSTIFIINQISGGLFAARANIVL